MSARDEDAVVVTHRELLERCGKAIERSWCDTDEDADAAWQDELIRHNRITEALCVLSCLRPGDRLPGGGVWMPVEATPDMLISGGIAWAECVDGTYVDNANAAYRAMIRAASEEPKS
jgi:hypothetical protein